MIQVLVGHGHVSPGLSHFNFMVKLFEFHGISSNDNRPTHGAWKEERFARKVVNVLGIKALVSNDVYQRRMDTNVGSLESCEY